MVTVGRFSVKFKHQLPTAKWLVSISENRLHVPFPFEPANVPSSVEFPAGAA
jgi:hypothetical protein